MTSSVVVARSDAGVVENPEMVRGYFPVQREWLRQTAGTLCGGQQQMLVIARGLMARPEGHAAGRSVARLVSDSRPRHLRHHPPAQRGARGVAMLLAEQNARVALDVTDSGYVMEVGRTVMDVPAERLRRSRDIEEFYPGRQERSLQGERRWERRKTWR